MSRFEQRQSVFVSAGFIVVREQIIVNRQVFEANRQKENDIVRQLNDTKL